MAQASLKRWLMDRYLPLVPLASIVIAAILSRLATRRIVDWLSNPVAEKPHFLTTPMGIAVLFAGVFVVVWFAVSFLLVIPWLLAQSHKRVEDRPPAHEKLERKADSEQMQRDVGSRPCDGDNG